MRNEYENINEENLNVELNVVNETTPLMENVRNANLLNPQPNNAPVVSAKKSSKFFKRASATSFIIGASAATSSVAPIFGNVVTNTLDVVPLFLDDPKKSKFSRAAKILATSVQTIQALIFLISTVLLSGYLYKNIDYYRRLIAPRSFEKEIWRIFKDDIRKLIDEKKMLKETKTSRKVVDSNIQPLHNKNEQSKQSNAQLNAFIFEYKKKRNFSYTIRKSMFHDFLRDNDLAHIIMENANYLIEKSNNGDLLGDEQSALKGYLIASRLLYFRAFSQHHRFRLYFQNEKDIERLQKNSIFKDKATQAENNIRSGMAELEKLNVDWQRLKNRIIETLNRIAQQDINSEIVIENEKNILKRYNERSFLYEPNKERYQKYLAKEISPFFKPHKESCETVLTDSEINRILKDYSLTLEEMRGEIPKLYIPELKHVSTKKCVIL